MIDNRDETVADHLRSNLNNAEFFRIVSAYFAIYGYETLQGGLDNLKHVRFLIWRPKHRRRGRSRSKTARQHGQAIPDRANLCYRRNIKLGED